MLIAVIDLRLPDTSQPAPSLRFVAFAEDYESPEPHLSGALLITALKCRPGSLLHRRCEVAKSAA